MDTNKIPFQRLTNVIAIIWVAVLITAFWGYTQKFSFGQLVKNTVAKEQNLPLLVMAQGENKPLPGSRGFDSGRLISAHQDNYIFIGPYWPLLPGNYQVSWEIVPDCPGNLGSIDVVSRLEGSEYAKVDVVGQKAGEIQIVDLNFLADFSWNYEMRFYAKNNCGFKVLRAKLIRKNLDFKSLFNQALGKLQ